MAKANNETDELKHALVLDLNWLLIRAEEEAVAMRYCSF